MSPLPCCFRYDAARTLLAVTCEKLPFSKVLIIYPKIVTLFLFPLPSVFTTMSTFPLTLLGQRAQPLSLVAR